MGSRPRKISVRVFGAVLFFDKSVAATREKRTLRFRRPDVAYVSNVRLFPR